MIRECRVRRPLDPAVSRWQIGCADNVAFPAWRVRTWTIASEIASYRLGSERIPSRPVRAPKAAWKREIVSTGSPPLSIAAFRNAGVRVFTLRNDSTVRLPPSSSRAMRSYNACPSPEATQSGLPVSSRTESRIVSCPAMEHPGLRTGAPLLTTMLRGAPALQSAEPLVVAKVISRSRPSRRRPGLVAREMRTRPFPPAPKVSPGATATSASSTRRRA